jgi:hypothetical protein
VLGCQALVLSACTELVMCLAPSSRAEYVCGASLLELQADSTRQGLPAARLGCISIMGSPLHKLFGRSAECYSSLHECTTRHAATLCPGQQAGHMMYI